MRRWMTATLWATVASLAAAAPPPMVSHIGTSSAQENAGPPGFTSLFKNGEANTPGMSRSGGKGGRHGAGGGGGFNGGRIGPSTGYGRNGVRPPIPTPPTHLGSGGYGGYR